MKRCYNIAGIEFTIEGKDEEMFSDDLQLKTFRSEKQENSLNYRYNIVNSLSENTGQCIYEDVTQHIFVDGTKQIHYMGFLEDGIEGAYIRVERLQDNVEVQIRADKIHNQITNKIVLNTLGIEKIVDNANGFILHASFVELNGKAILFTAPSGFGKSTQAELWKNLRGAEIINGDRAIVKVKGDKLYACGLPYAGSSEYCKNVEIPLEAIVCLIKGKTTKIDVLKGGQAFREMWEQIVVPTWDKGMVKRIACRLERVLLSVPIYYLECTPDETAVKILEQALMNNNQNK